MGKTVMLPREFNYSFLTYKRDCEIVLRKLFVESKPYSNMLKRLLLIQNADCLNTEQPAYDQKVNEYSLARLIEEGYIHTTPLITLEEHPKIKSYIVVSFDNFTPTSNDKYRECTLSFDIICHSDALKMSGFAVRNLEIAGYIDGILHDSKLSGIGKIEFINCVQVVLNQDFTCYTLTYRLYNGENG